MMIFANKLRRLRNELGETQAQTAAAIGVSRANLTQWETGKYLPSAQNARQLDDYFQAGNVLVNLVEAAKSPHGTRPSDSIGVTFVTDPGSLPRVFQQVGRGLVDRLILDDHGEPLGWRHNLQKERYQTAQSTAYGIKAMLVVGEPYVDFDALVHSLMAMRSPHGGWLGRSGASRSEITATVLDALFRVGTSITVDEAMTLMAQSLSPLSKARPYLLATALQTVARLRPDGPLADELVDSLLAARLEFDDTRLWPEKIEPGLALAEPSAVHTARAVVALREVLRGRDDRHDAREAVEGATQWLAGHARSDDGVTEELIRPRPDGDGSTRVNIRHFTSAWAVQALAGAPQIPIARLNRALRVLWNRYDRERGLWAWGNGDLPIWMTLDSVTALRTAALLLAAPPVRPPEE
jgi:DNA-binding XRE family transcriptional regulator